MTYRFLRGIYVDNENKAEKLVTRVVNTMCAAFDDAIKMDDEALKLALVKAGHTAITLSDIGVHEGLYQIAN